MTAPTSSAAPVTSVLRATSRQRLLLRLRRLVVSASWLPFVLLVFVAVKLDQEVHGVSVVLASLASIAWPVVVIRNVVRGRPPRWGPFIHALVGLLNLTLAVTFVVLIASLANHRISSTAALLFASGGIVSLVLGIAVLVRKRHRFSVTFVAALVVTVAALFLTLGLTAMVEARPWPRWFGGTFEAIVNDDMMSMAPTSASAIVAPTPV